MITRFALFERSVRPDWTEAFRAAVRERLVPLWTRFTGNTDVRVMFSEERDADAPEFPLILDISYPDRATMDAALECPARFASGEVTGEIVAEFFENQIHHHVNTSELSKGDESEAWLWNSSTLSDMSRRLSSSRIAVTRHRHERAVRGDGCCRVGQVADRPRLRASH